MKNSENNAKISIVMPVYNAQKTIAQTLDSLLNQTFNDYEIICVNDGSKDDSLKVLEERKEKNREVKFVHNPRERIIALVIKKCVINLFYKYGIA